MSIALLTPVKLNGTGAIVCDPCYHGSAPHCIYEVQKIQQGGEWKMETHREQMGDWGERTVELTVVHSTHSSGLPGRRGLGPDEHLRQPRRRQVRSR